MHYLRCCSSFLSLSSLEPTGEPWLLLSPLAAAFCELPLLVPQLPTILRRLYIRPAATTAGGRRRKVNSRRPRQDLD